MQKVIFCFLALFLFPFSSGFSSEKWCVIVDGFSTGKYYAPYFKKSGYRCIHIENKNLPAAIERNDYDVLLFYDDNLEKILGSLKSFDIKHVVAGSEPGVQLAEKISAALGLEKNAPGFSERSRDKYLTGQTLIKNGLRCIRQEKVSSSRQAVEWARHHNKWPVVVKPLDSAGADGFHSCQNTEDVKRAAKEILGHKMLFGKVNKEVLIQEYIDAKEYVVNTVSCNGQHRVQSFMVYEKRETPEGGLIIESYSLLDPSKCPQAKQIFQYAFKVLDALGIKVGPSHLEVFLTKEGPVLVECGARPHGNSFPDDLMIQCAGQSQIKLSLLAFTDPPQFEQATKEPYRLHKHMTAVRLAALAEGTVKSIHFLNEIENLPSFYLHRIYKKPGDFLPKTMDLQTLAGDIFLCSESLEQIKEDIQKIRSWEDIGIFELLNPCSTLKQSTCCE